MDPNRISRIIHLLIQCLELIPYPKSHTEEWESLTSCLHLAVPISYPSITEPSNPGISPPIQTPILHESLPNYRNHHHPSTRTSVESYHSASTSGTISLANQLKRSYLQPLLWSNPHTENSQSWIQGLSSAPLFLQESGHSGGMKFSRRLC